MPATAQKPARKTTTKRRTAEERKAEAEALQATLVEQVATLVTSDGWAQFLALAGTFHAYSLNNLLLILSQRPTATRVAGFRQWQARGRQVRKGEKGIRIFGYSSRKVETTNETTGETEEKRVTYYPILTVFDVAQTDPIEGTEQPQHPARLLTGDDPAAITDTVAAWLTAEGWDFAREPIEGNANGYTTIDGTRRVVVKDTLSGAAAAKTTLHEAAHVLLHVDDEPGEYVQHRGLKETEAESVAYVTAGLAGLDTSDYSVGYVATWAHGDLELIRSTAANVLQAVHTLADVLEPPAEL